MAFDEQKQSGNSELRKKRRKKEQIQAFAVLLGAILVVILIVSGVVSGVNALLGPKQEKQKAESVKQEPDKQEVAESEEQQQSADNTEVADTETTETTDTIDTEVVTDTEETVAEELSEEELEAKKAEILQSYVDNIMSTLTLEEKIGQMYLVTPYNITGVVDAKSAGSSISSALNQYGVGGILFDDGNMEDKDQFTLMINNIRSFSKLNMFYAVCDEGGESSSFSLGGIRENPLSSQSEIAAIGVAEAYSVGISKSSEFRNLGINLNLAPMTDVATNTESSIATQSYGVAASEILNLAKSEFKGMKDQGVDCCIKYFPGHGDVSGDTKTTRVISQRTKEQIDATEGVIYKGLIEEGVPMIMVSHVSMAKISEGNVPASLSSEIVTDILRTEWGFEGVIVTDYMSKNAITRFYKHADAAVMAVQAGVDMIAAPGDFQKSYNGLLEAVQSGEITEERINESVERILKMKYRNVIDYGLENEENSTEEDAAAEEFTEEAATDEVITEETTDDVESSTETE